ncbi:MAG: DUF808 domain-containing protein [Xanthomonadales bacterium]|nr:DUF808 domain-containing protein [Xanthomonadales bacterium]
MAGSSLLVLIDDIATILDDVAVMSKVAVKKTAGVLGDDLALNAEQVTGVKADRELPVVWAVCKGSLLNKAILVPAALAISAFIPWLILPLLMLGGAFLCFEGFEKVAHSLLHSRDEDEAHHREHLRAIADPKVDMVAMEKEKIRGAIRTDFILSAEILVITLGTVATATFPVQVAVMVTIALGMTLGVYGLVAGIVKLDDVGLHLSKREGEGGWANAVRAIGRKIVAGAPYFLKFLSIAGTAAMFLVGGGILIHGIPFLHHLVEASGTSAGEVPNVGWLLKGLTGIALNALVGIVAGGILVGLMTIWTKLRGAKAAA